MSLRCLQFSKWEGCWVIVNSKEEIEMMSLDIKIGKLKRYPVVMSKLVVRYMALGLTGKKSFP